MDERWANIDMVFRNGLKDYEVLPPSDIWNNISPGLRKKKKAVYLLRIAAVSAALALLGSVAVWLSRNVSDEIDNAIAEMNQNAAAPISVQKDTPIYILAESKYGKKPETYNSMAVTPARKEIIPTPEHAELHVAEIISVYNEPQENIISHAIQRPEVKIESYKLTPEELYPVEKPVTDKGKRWTIAALASPTYNARTGSAADEFSRQLLANESQTISYSGGVSFSYKVNKRFSIQSGVFYSSIGKEVGGINSFGGFQKYVNSKGSHNFEVLTSNGSVLTNNADVFLSSGMEDRIITNYTNDYFDPEKASLDYIGSTLNQNFSYLELPIGLRYKIIDKKLDVNVLGGISYNLLVKNSVYTRFDGGKYPIGQTEGLNPVSVSSTIGMGLEYNISESFSLNLEPTVRYFLNPFNELSGNDYNPYSFGIFSGLSFRF